MARGNSRDILEFLFVGPLFSIFKQLNAIRRELKDVATQAEIDALTSRVNEVSATQTKALGEIKTEIENLKTANPDIDTTALEGAVASAESGAKDLDDVVPDVLPEPTPEPEPTPPAETPAEGETPSEGTAFDADGNPVS